MANTETDGFNLRSYALTISRRRWLIVLVTAGVVAVAVGVSFLQATTYQASAEIVLQPRSTESVFDGSSGGTSQTSRTVETEVRVLKSDAVKSAVRQAIGSAPPVSAARVGETESMRITARSSEAALSAQIANAYADAYIDLRKNQAVGDLEAASDQIKSRISALQTQISDLDRRLSQASPADRPAVEATVGPRYTNLLTEQSLLSQKLDSLEVDSTLKSGGVQLVSAAKTPKSPASPKPIRNGAMALVVGLVIGTALAFLREHLDDSVRTKDDLARAVPETSVMGLVPITDTLQAPDAVETLERLRAGNTPAAEAFRTIRTAVQLLGVERPIRTLQVTSPSAGEGKTLVIAHLATVLAGAGQRVVMVDGDLRRSALSRLFELSDVPGFTSLFLDEVSPMSVVRRVMPNAPLFLVPSGPTPTNPSELLGASRTAQFVFELQSEFDVVIVDSAPVLPVADAVVLATWVEATVLVAAAGETTTRALRETVERLGQVDARIVGAILNKASAEATSQYGYGYPYVGTAPKGRRNGSRVRRHQARQSRG